VLIIGVPASIALLLLAEPILITLFQYGALEPGDVAMAALSLRAYSVGLLAFMLVKVLAPGFYARQDMVTPVRIGITAMVANMVMNLAFVVPLYLFFNIGHVGLALATSLSAWLNAGLLLRDLRRTDVLSFQPGWARFFTRLACATLAMVLTLLWLVPPQSDWQSWSWWQRGAQMSILVCAGLVTYAVVQLALGARLRDITAGSGSAG
jgi:putative peptidoglycan lipid II flippase